MAEKKGKQLFLRPNERLDGRLAGLAEEFEFDSRQEVVFAVLKDFLGAWERIERRKRELIAAYEQRVLDDLVEPMANDERGAEGITVDEFDSEASESGKPVSRR